MMYTQDRLEWLTLLKSMLVTFGSDLGIEAKITEKLAIMAAVELVEEKIEVEALDRRAA